jgi:two-component system, cell cycle response regulator
MAVGKRPGMSSDPTAGDPLASRTGAGERTRPADPAQLLEADRKLRESAQRHDDLLALAAEDLRAPAAELLRGLRRLRRSGAGPELDHLLRHARRVALVADGLVALRSVEGGSVPLRRRRPADLRELVERVASARTALARERGVEIARDLPPHRVTLGTDADRVEEAVGALLDGALSRSLPGDRVRLTLEATPDGARLVVEDRPPDSTRPPRPRRRTPARVAEIGLGLAVCRSLAELHGGALAVLTRGDRRAIELKLPLSGAEATEGAVSSPAAARSRLLVVDDDEDAREALAMMLGDEYDVALAADGLEALEAAQASRPDLVLMDLYMPRMDGLAALEALRIDPATEHVPVILISARGDDLTRSRSLDLGALDFLSKPFSGRELKARVERTLRLTRRETQLQQLARTDVLTGLPNVRAFRGRLHDEVIRARRYRTPLACAMVDMDNLKPINDQLGHAAGDAAIATVAEVIRRELRETDFAARYGGDEFVILLPHTTAAEARVLTERVRDRLAEASPQVQGRPVTVAASFGVAALDEGPLDQAAEALVRRADAALYAAKRSGRGQVVAHPSTTPELEDDAESDTAAP